MTTATLFRLVCLALIVLGALFYWFLRWQKEGEKASVWQDFAAQMGMQYREHDAAFAECYPGFRLFSVGHNRFADHIVEGNAAGIGICIAEYVYVFGNGGAEEVQRQTVLILQNTQMNVPHCVLRRETIFDQIAAHWNVDDVDFDNDPLFTKTFLLRGEDPPAVWELFDESVRALFLRRKKDTIFFEAAGDKIVYHQERCMTPQEARELLSYCFDILQCWSSIGEASEVSGADINA